MVEFDFQTVSVVVAAIGVFIAAVNNIIQTRNANRTRQAQLFMQIYDHYNDIDFQRNHFYIMNLEWEDFNDYWEKYGPYTNPETNAIIASYAGFFEGIGVLVKRKLIDSTLVDDLMSGNITSYWEKMRPLVKQIRINLNWPQAFEWTEYLYNKIKKTSTNTED